MEIINELDTAALHQQYLEKGYVVIRNLLREEVAEAAFESLKHNVPWAFQAAVFTQNLQTAELASSQLNASAVMVNEHTAFRADWMPFAGWSASGYDIGGIPHTFHSMTREKMVVTKN